MTLFHADWGGQGPSGPNKGVISQGNSTRDDIREVLCSVVWSLQETGSYLGGTCRDPSLLRHGDRCQGMSPSSPHNSFTTSLSAQVDCTVERDLCSEFGVKGFPTLVLFKEGERLAPYTGSRDLQSLLKFAKQNSS